MAILPAGKRLMQYFQPSSYQFGGFFQDAVAPAGLGVLAGAGAGCAGQRPVHFPGPPATGGPEVVEILRRWICAALILLSGVVNGFISYQEKKVKKRLVA